MSTHPSPPSPSRSPTESLTRKDTGRRDAPDDREVPHSGETQPILEGGPAPRLPHERDESVPHEREPQREVIKQAGRDIKKGLVDTDKGPVLRDLHERMDEEKGGSQGGAA